MKPVSGCDIGPTAEDFLSAFANLDQVEETERSTFVIEEQIDVGIAVRFAARRRSEQEQALDAQIFQFRLMGAQPTEGFLSQHALF